MPYLFLIFIVIPLIEIGMFIVVGDEIGVAWTLILCVITALLGGTLVRYQGLHTLVSARTRLDAGALPVDALFDGLCIIIAGALLLTPGFVTDTVGFALLVPYFRRLLMQLGSTYGEKHFSMHTSMGGHRPGHDHSADPANDPFHSAGRGGDIIDADYERLDNDDDTPKHQSSRNEP